MQAYDRKPLTPPGGNEVLLRGPGAYVDLEADNRSDESGSPPA